MIRVLPTPPADPEWVDWLATVKLKTEELIAAVADGKEPVINDLYKAQKDRILKIFHDKCAYCETRIVGDQPGDIDHFRPKGRITDANGRPVQVGGREHPGYYWLAYHWKNLLPSCARCNRPTTQRDGKRIGKWDLFPVEGFRAEQPGDEVKEHPLLINPLETDPSPHFTFDELCVIAGVTAEGRACVDVLGLNREGLPEARRETFDKVRMQFNAFVDVCKRSDPDAELERAKLRRELDGYTTGSKPYAAVGRLALKRQHEVFQRNFGFFTGDGLSEPAR